MPRGPLAETSIDPLRVGDARGGLRRGRRSGQLADAACGTGVIGHARRHGLALLAVVPDSVAGGHVARCDVVAAFAPPSAGSSV